MPNLIKVSDIIVSDDGCGPYRLVLGGPDASFFKIIDEKLYFDKDLITTTTLTTTTTSSPTTQTTNVPSSTTVSPITTSTTLTSTSTTSTTLNPISAPYSITFYQEGSTNIWLMFYDSNGFIPYYVEYYDYGDTYPSASAQQSARNTSWNYIFFDLQEVSQPYHAGYIYSFNVPGGFYQFRIAAIVNGAIGSYGYSDISFAGTTTTTTVPSYIEISALPHITCPWNQSTCNATFNASARLYDNLDRQLIVPITYKWYTSQSTINFILQKTETSTTGSSLLVSANNYVRCVASYQGFNSTSQGSIRFGAIA
jgi:hypothetical protein